MNWLHEIPLSPKASALRRQLDVVAFASLQHAAERLVLVTDLPIAEVVDRLLCGVQAMWDGEGPDEFLTLIQQIIDEHES